MAFEASGERSFNTKSPGGFEFGLQGWTWEDPKPTSITFFLDGTAMVCDQYGRQIRRALTPDGRELRFADTPPEANREGDVYPRPQFATHKQVLDVLAQERINWLSYEVRWVTSGGAERKNRTGLTLAEAVKVQARLIQDGCRSVMIAREIACAGWPQLTYDELKKLPEIPPTPLSELKKILDPALRRDALRMRREVDGVREKELATAAEE